MRHCFVSFANKALRSQRMTFDWRRRTRDSICEFCDDEDCGGQMRQQLRLIILTIAITSVLAPLGGRGQSGGLGRGTQQVAFDDYTGYVKLWDGQTFKGW